MILLHPMMGVIPKPRVFTSGARDLACISTVGSNG
jgi:hypothetical protein